MGEKPCWRSRFRCSVSTRSRRVSSTSVGMVAHAGLGVADGQETRELTPGLGQGNGFGAGRGRRGLATGLDLVDQVAKLMSEFAVAAPGGLGRHLPRDGVEAGVVSLGVASDQRFGLVGGGHGVCCSAGRVGWNCEGNPMDPL